MRKERGMYINKGIKKMLHVSVYTTIVILNIWNKKPKNPNMMYIESFQIIMTAIIEITT